MTTPIVRIKFGSHLYGTATEASDTDWKSVHVPDAEDILLQRAQAVLNARTAQRPRGVRNQPDEVDDESYALHRYLQLLAEGQTVAVDMLFAPESAFDWEPHWAWRSIQGNAALFISKKSAAFVGYCRTQAAKYGLKGSRLAAAKASMEFFAGCVLRDGPTARVGDCESHLLRGLCDNEHTRLVEQERPFRSAGEMDCVIAPPKEWFFECCNRKVSLGNTVKAAHETYARVYAEYGERARMAEAGGGVDWKALSHAVRVGHEAVELLRDHRITFPLAVAPLVLGVKRGQVPYAEVVAMIERLLEEVEAASRESTLPEEPDRAAMDRLTLAVYGAEVRERMQAEGAERRAK